MERLVIEKLEGAHRNSVEGVTNAPEVVKNLDFDRSGGYTPLGGIDSNWLGSQELSAVLDENGENILYELGDGVGTEWQPSPFLDNAAMLAYDEAGMVLLSGPQLWYDNALVTFTGASFDNETDLALTPRAGIITPWRQVASAYIGASRFVQTDGTLSYGAGAGTVTVTGNAGTGTAAGDYEFIWVLEAPTDNGLVVFAVGTHEHTVSAEIESCSIELDTVHPEGTTARFYYRTTAEDSYERFAVAVSDGANEMTVTLVREGDFVPTADALISFAGGRIEAHNGRMWGPAAERPITTFQPSTQLQRQSGGYMLVSGGAVTDARQYSTVALADMALRAVGDYVQLNIEKLAVTRPVTDEAVVVELFNNRHTASTGLAMNGLLLWEIAATKPKLILYLTDSSGTNYHVMTAQEVSLANFALGRLAGSSINVNSFTLKVTIDGVSTAGSTTLYSTTYTITQGAASQTRSEVDRVQGGATLWGTYSTAAETSLAIGRLSDEIVDQWLPGLTLTVGSWTTGNREMRVSSIEAGNGATVRVLGSIEDYGPDALTWTSSGPEGETWTTTSHNNMVLVYELKNITLPDENPVTNPGLTLAYSSTGSVNRGSNTNFLTFSPLSSSRITALASTPAGLLVFLENETFLVRGDPATGDLNSQRLSGTIGCDPGIIPARMGAVVMPIYKGEVYAVNLGGGDVDFGGSLVNISRSVWRPDDPFVQVVGEAKRQHIVARTGSGRVYRMEVAEQKWLNDPFDESLLLRWFFPNDTDIFYGTRYNVGGYLSVVNDDLTATPLVEWTALDAGDKNLMKLWRRMEVFTEGVGDGTPTLTYTARGISETVNGIDKGEGRWVFTFNRGVVSPTIGLQLEFLGATGDFVMEPPVVIEYVPRYRQR